MPDEIVESSSTTETTVATETAPEGAVEASAETKNTESTPPAEHMIPKSRLDEVIQERNSLREKISGLEAAPPKEAPKGSEGDDTAPEHLNERERVRWYVENDARSMIERETGVSLKDQGTLLSTSRVTAQSDADRRWKEGCDRNGLDPENREVQEMVLGLTKVGVGAPDAFKRVSKMGIGQVESRQTEPTTPTATVENNGVTNVMTSKVAFANNRREAAELASKGVKAGQLSSQELIEQAMKNERSAGG